MAHHGRRVVRVHLLAGPHHRRFGHHRMNARRPFHSGTFRCRVPPRLTAILSEFRTARPHSAAPVQVANGLRLLTRFRRLVHALADCQ